VAKGHQHGWPGNREAIGLRTAAFGPRAIAWLFKAQSFSMIELPNCAIQRTANTHWCSVIAPPFAICPGNQPTPASSGVAQSGVRPGCTKP